MSRVSLLVIIIEKQQHGIRNIRGFASAQESIIETEKVHHKTQSVQGLVFTDQQRGAGFKSYKRDRKKH